MAKLAVLVHPDERLRTVAKPVKQIDDGVRQLASDMLETMYHEGGIGLAATQVDRHVRLIVLDVSKARNQPRVLINPRVVLLSRRRVGIMDEGCLSVPGWFAPVPRAKRVQVNARNERGEPVRIRATGRLAVCIQHEVDHLDGKLFVDYVDAESLRHRTDLLLEK